MGYGFFGTGGLPDVQGFAVPLLEDGGDPGLLPSRVPQACPAFVDSALLEFPANQLHRLIGVDDDEEMSIAALFEVMIDWPHAELGFQTPRHGF